MPEFANYQEAWSFVEERAKNYPSRAAYYASEEYKAFFPTLKTLAKTHNIGLATQAQKAMKEVGVKDGSCVEYLDANPWGMVFEYKGKVKLDKEGVPYVTLTEKTADGRKRVRWHKGFRPIPCRTKQK